MSDLRLCVSSTDLARVTEIEPMRRFDVGNDGQDTPSVVTYDSETDNLWCDRHESYDSCTCTARVRLCGVLTGHVIANVKHWKGK